MSKLLANQIANYNDNGPVEVKEGVNVPSGKPFQVGGAAGTAGQYLKTTGSTIAWTDFPTIPAAQVSSDWNATAGIAKILNKPTLATVATSGSYSDLSNKPTIPAAQVSSDWNATSGVERILNKPNLFSGSYTDLTNKPTIPSNLADLANVASTAPNNNEVLKWNGSNWAPATDASGGGGVTAFTALTDTPANFTSQAGKFLKVNAGATALEYTDAPAGTTTFTGLTDTPANFTSQAGKYLKVNAGATALEYVDPIQNGDIDFGGHLSLPDNKEIRLGNDNDLKIYHNGAANHFVTTTHTTYWDVPYFVLRKAGGNTTDYYARFGNNNGCQFYYNHGLKLKTITEGIKILGGIKDKDDNLGTAGQVLSSTGTELDWIDAPSGAASVTTDDNAPGSPSDGDLWWKSDEGRLKVYYADANTSQWVDASPPLTASSNLITNTTTNGTNSITTTTSTSGANANAIEIKTDNNTASAIRWRFTPPGHLIPFANAQYDIGNAEYKVRHMFLSDNTVYFEGDFLKVAQHNASGSAQAASYLIPLAKLKDALNASADYEAFKTAILAITDA